MYNLKSNVISKGLVIVFITFLILSCSSSQEEREEFEGSQEESNNIDIPGSIRNITSMEFVGEMGVGWNLGNSLDTKSIDKTDWGNPLPSKEIIDKVYEIGYRTLRIPVTWGYHQESDTYLVNEDYLDLVQETVNFGIRKGMHVILNIHHDNTWIRPTLADASQVKPRLESLWTQIANRFKVYGDLLIFETLNENRLLNSVKEWSGGTQEGRTVLNEYHKIIFDAIRATGGNNEVRHILISTYAASTINAAMNDLVIPNNDSRAIISLHSYYPWSFCGPDNKQVTNWGSDKEKSDLKRELERIHKKWVIDEGRPVVLGEWGAADKDNLEARETYYKFYVSESTKLGMLPIVWDDGGNFRLLDRGNLTWYFPTLAKLIVDSVN